MDAPKVTAEQVKELVRRYAEQSCPGWRSAGVLILIGELGEDTHERLYVHREPVTPAESPLPSA